MTTKLTETQCALLHSAVHTNDGRITSDLIKTAIPHVRGGAASRVITALGSQGLVAYDEEGCYVTGEGQRALSPDLPCTAVHGFGNACPECAIEPDAEVDSNPSDSTPDSPPTRERRTRENSKQAEVIRMLQRPEGATIAQIAAETGWQQHSVRGFFVGALKKRGVRLTSTKTDAGRIYRIDHAAS
jgi:hypothetical protein